MENSDEKKRIRESRVVHSTEAQHELMVEERRRKEGRLLLKTRRKLCWLCGVCVHSDD
jgi:hypothetical protein